MQENTRKLLCALGAGGTILLLMIVMDAQQTSERLASVEKQENTMEPNDQQTPPDTLNTNTVYNGSALNPEQITETAVLREQNSRPMPNDNTAPPTPLKLKATLPTTPSVEQQYLDELKRHNLQVEADARSQKYLESVLRPARDMVQQWNKPVQPLPSSAYVTPVDNPWAPVGSLSNPIYVKPSSPQFPSYNGYVSPIDNPWAPVGSRQNPLYIQTNP